MGFFDDYISCTAAGSGSQNWFSPDTPDGKITCRTFYRLSRDVETCALMYSNLIDSTYADGARSHANFVTGEWDIHSLRAGKVTSCAVDICPEPERLTDLTFDLKCSKHVMAGELFYTDPFGLTAKKGEYLCVEMTFSGARVPCHTESLLPSFRLEDGCWRPCTDMPYPCLVASPRGKELRLGFLGDSITQGIGTEPNSYDHVAALVQDALGEKTAVWNLGLGYGRAQDAALDGSWLYRARQNDLVCVCFGVNDLFQLGSAEGLKKDLAAIVKKLRESGVRVLIQTVPPFDYAGGTLEMWRDVNGYIRNELSKTADAVFDTVPVLGGNAPGSARFGPHPDAAGNAAWARALLEAIRGVTEKMG